MYCDSPRDYEEKGLLRGELKNHNRAVDQDIPDLVLISHGHQWVAEGLPWTIVQCSAHHSQLQFSFCASKSEGTH